MAETEEVPLSAEELKRRETLQDPEQQKAAKEATQMGLLQTLTEKAKTGDQFKLLALMGTEIVPSIPGIELPGIAGKLFPMIEYANDFVKIKALFQRIVLGQRTDIFKDVSTGILALSEVADILPFKLLKPLSIAPEAYQLIANQKSIGADGFGSIKDTILSFIKGRAPEIPQAASVFAGK